MYKREISKRGVIYITKLCNIRCKFCYYLDEEDKKHADIDSIERTFKWFKETYGLDYLDITGGEPTIHPDIIKIVKSSNEHGIKPTIITNGQRVDVVEQLIDVGLEDILLSIHGINNYYDEVVQKKGAFQKLEKTVDLLQNRKFSFRTNTTLTKYSCQDIEEIVDWLISNKPRIVNLIAFNPHEGTLWSDQTGMDFQVSYSKMAEAAKYAIERLSKENIWVNVRYLPLCFMKGYEQHVCNFHQWQYDPYEWECTSDSRMSVKDIAKNKEIAIKQNLFGENASEKLHLYLMKQYTKENRFLDCCQKCTNKNICDGVYSQYLKTFGSDEIKAVSGESIFDPLHYRIECLEWSILKK